MRQSQKRVLEFARSFKSKLVKICIYYEYRKNDGFLNKPFWFVCCRK